MTGRLFEACCRMKVYSKERRLLLAGGRHDHNRQPWSLPLLNSWMSCGTSLFAARLMTMRYPRSKDAYRRLRPPSGSLSNM